MTPDTSPQGSETPPIPIQVSRGSLVATVQVDLGEEVLRRFQRDLLDAIRRTDVTRVVLDLSSVPVIDAHDFEHLRRTLAMASLMGATCVLAGIQAGVASALVELGVSTGGLHTALGLDDALDALEPETGAEVEVRQEEEDAGAR